VMKDNLARLLPAIERALRQAEMRKSHDVATGQLVEHLHLAALRSDVATAISASTNVRSMLSACCNALVRHLGGALARAWTLDSKDNTLVLQASAGMHVDRINAIAAVTQPKIEMIARERRPHVTDDIADDPRLRSHTWARDDGLRIFAGYPLLVEGRLVGVLALLAGENVRQNTLDALGAIARSIAVDIDRRDIEEQLKEALSASEASDRLKSAFLDSMSHEIRTPLNVIIGFNELIVEEVGNTENPELHSWLAAIKAASHRLINTVDGIIDMAKLQSATFVCEPRPLRVRKIVEAQINEFRTLANVHDLELVCQLAEPDAVVTFDEYCLSKILYALLDNACKFTRAGTITVRLYRAEDESLRLQVMDTGIGIHEADLSRIWEPFSQVESTTTRSFEGSGLGLTVAKQFCRLNGAHLEVQSAPGKGTAVTLTFGGVGIASAPARRSTPRTEIATARETGR